MSGLNFFYAFFSVYFGVFRLVSPFNFLRHTGVNHGQVLGAVDQDNDFPVSLYEESPQVAEFNARNFGHKVYGDYHPKPAHFVEFYASWCGHCQKYAPVWANLATASQNWHKIVVVAAVNCALSENELLCLSNNVTHYPQIKYFPRKANKPSDGYVVKASHSVIKTKAILINQILNEYNATRHPDWPNFHFLPDLQKLVSIKDVAELENRPFLGLIFEQHDDKVEDTIGIEVILDLASNNSIAARRVSFKNPLTFHLGIETFPTFVLVDSQSNKIIYKSNFRKALGDDISRLLGVSNASVLAAASTTTSPVPSTTLSNEQLKLKHVLTETDLLLTAKHALLDTVTSRYYEMGAPELLHLQNFVGLLRDHFPPLNSTIRRTLKLYGFDFPGTLKRSEKAKNLFDQLYMFINKSRSENKTISRADWIEKFTKLEEANDKPFPSAQYVHCKGSKPTFRGYTCGLWTMFHTLTVNAFYERGYMQHFEPLSILKAIQGYVENFFGCAECASHFVAMVTGSFKMEHFVHNAADVVIYLWQAHNIVNKRLANTNTEDPIMRKVQFPPEFLCPYCRNSTTGRWDERGVLHFLTRYYGTDIQPRADS